MIPNQVGEFRWVYSDPNILIHHFYNQDNPNDYGSFLSQERNFRFVHLCWTRTAEELLRDYKTMQSLRPTHVFCHMIPDASLFDHCVSVGLPSIHFSHNALIDENIYNIKQINKKYDAILNARANPGKRHWLAAKVDNLLCSTYENKWCDQVGYLEEVKKQLPQADFLINSGPFGGPVPITEAYNQSKIGLVLSVEEGASLSSVEYMLCGLPVVTTANVGGRNEFMDPEFTLIVAPTQESVRDGVKELLNKNVNPELVRGRTIQRMIAHRGRFIEHVQKILNYHQKPVNYSSIFHSKMPKMGEWRNLSQIYQFKEEWK